MTSKIGKISEIDLARIAAFIDGEGTVIVTKHKNKYYIEVSVSNTDKRLIDYLTSLIPGTSRCNRKTGNCKIGYEWKIKDKKAQVVLEKLLPYLILKKERALLAIKFQSQCHNRWNFSGREVPRWMQKRRENFYQEMKILNKRGIY